jgi:hypothetical protein
LIWRRNNRNKKAPHERGLLLLVPRRQLLLGAFLDEAGELLLEARHAATAVHQLLLTAGPGRMRLRIDVEVKRVAFLPQVERVVNSLPSVMMTLMV